MTTSWAISVGGAPSRGLAPPRLDEASARNAAAVVAASERPDMTVTPSMRAIAMARVSPTDFAKRSRPGRLRVRTLRVRVVTQTLVFGIRAGTS